MNSPPLSGIKVNTAGLSSSASTFPRKASFIPGNGRSAMATLTDFASPSPAFSILIVRVISSLTEPSSGSVLILAIVSLALPWTSRPITSVEVTL